jgi:hypothetical protein
MSVGSAPINVANNLATIPLASSAGYAIVAESGITNTGSSFITGSMLVSPIDHSAITGFGLTLDGSGAFSTSSLVSGHILAADYTAPTPTTAGNAVADFGTALGNLQGRSGGTVNLGSGEIGGLTLTSGVYNWSTGLSISNDVTFSGGPNDIFILNVAGTLTMAAAKSMILAGGALASNIFIGTSGQMTIGASAVVNANLLSATGIALITGASVNGHLMAGTNVTLQSNAVNQ